MQPVEEPPLSKVHLEGFAGQSVRSSPFLAGQLAVASAANFGIVGQGRLQVFQTGAPQATFTTNAGLCDCAWSEKASGVLLAASMDGHIRLYDVQAAAENRPLTQFSEHTAEVSGIDWNLVAKESFVSSSWDGSVKLWVPERPASVVTLVEHAGSKIYECRCAPHHPSWLLSAAGDGTARVWDPAAGAAAVARIEAGQGTEVLSADWSKYDPNVFATGSVDCAVRQTAPRTLH